MGALWAYFRGPQEHEIEGTGPRCKNVVVNNLRGIIGFFVLLGVLGMLIFLTHEAKPETRYITVLMMWIWMFLFFLIQPIYVPCTGMIPIFLLPMCGVMSTMDTTKCYFNEGVCLFILASMLILLLNNAGFDRRIALYLLTCGSESQFSGISLVLKGSLAAYILSMFCNRLLVTSTLIQSVTPILIDMQARRTPTDANFDAVRYVLNNAIQSSSSIGSIAILHSSMTTLMFKAVWLEASGSGTEYPDIFNYLQYSLFAFPVSFVMFLFNLGYHVILALCLTGKAMSSQALKDVRDKMLKLLDTIPEKLTLHEILAVFFTFLALACLASRWTQWFGWASYNLQPIALKVPVIKDACVVAIFVIILHILPRSCNFIKTLSAKKPSEVKDIKPESAILWWRFVDKNTNYGYFFVFGAAIALNEAISNSQLNVFLGEQVTKHITELDFFLGLAFVCMATCVLANIMTGCAALACLLPLVINMSSPAPEVWQKKLYLPALGVGIGSSLGFILPFMYTPAYFCHHTGKVPVLKMFIFEFFSVCMCGGILYAALCVYGPLLWDPEDNGILPEAAPVSGLLANLPPLPPIPNLPIERRL